jgi:hypothetical protein
MTAVSMPERAPGRRWCGTARRGLVHESAGHVSVHPLGAERAVTRQSIVVEKGGGWCRYTIKGIMNEALVGRQSHHLLSRESACLKWA